MVAQVVTVADPIMAFTTDEWDAIGARYNLHPFTRRLFPGYTTAPHIRILCDALESAVATPDSRLIVTMPPRHSKSVHVSEHLPAWFLGRNPDKRVIAASHTQDLANTFSRRVRNKMSHPAWPFPGVAVAGDKGAVQAWDIAGYQGGYKAIGVGGTPVGLGGDLIVIDDPIKSAADADSETMRASVWEWYRETLRTRLEPGGSMILTATRWHADDLTGRLLAASTDGTGESWQHIHMPALDDDGTALWPDRWPAESLAAIKQAVGSRAWNAQFQGSPTPAEGGMFKRQWWQRYRVLPPITRAELVMDAAFKEGVSNDYTALALWGTDGQGSAYLINAWRARVEFPGLLRLARDAYAWSSARYPGLPLVIEDKASGQSAVQVLRTADGSNPALPIVAYAPPGNLSKTARAEGITGMVEGGRVFIPESAPWLEDWIAEHERFPLGTHDDWVDTSSMGVSRLIVTAQTVVRIW